jgi:cytochrome b subunit of formate dehydrogenase
VDRFVHFLVIVSFFGLVMTGVPLHFSHAPWAATLIRLHGGVESAGVVHRTCAVIMFGYFFLHVGWLSIKAWRSPQPRRFLWGPDSMVPQPRDVRDLVQSFLWFVGRGEKPRFDRFSYFEKVDYWAELWGVAIIGGSGLLLWFPEAFASWLPGWIFNIATVVHGIEALLAMCFIFTIHIFNGQLRPEKFPLDVVIFTGRATAQYLEEEHPLEYERLLREGRLEERFAPPPPRWLYLAAVVLAVCAITIGLTITGLVIWAGLS